MLCRHLKRTLQKPVPLQMRTNQPKVVGDIMTTGTLFSCSPDDTVDDVLECLIQNRITGLPVVDESGKVVRSGSCEAAPQLAHAARMHAIWAKALGKD